MIYDDIFPKNTLCIAELYETSERIDKARDYAPKYSREYLKSGRYVNTCAKMKFHINPKWRKCYE